MKAKRCSILLDNAIRLREADLPRHVIERIKKRLTIRNPRWEQVEKYSRWNTNNQPEYLTFYKAENGWLILPRGFISQLRGILNHIRYTLEDRTRTTTEVDFIFNGELRPHQLDAARDVLTRRFGVLEAPPGTGKTVMALAVIASRRQPALVIVHTKELMYQWQARAVEFLDMDPAEVGLIGDGHSEIGPRLTVAIVNSLCADEVKKHVGHVIVDECHRVPSRTFTEAVSAFDCAYMLGLSATPYRRDGLTKVIYIYLGDRAHQIKTSEAQATGRIMRATLRVRYTDFDYPFASEDYQGMLAELTEDQARNKMIVADVVSQVKSDPGIVLVISDRISHCQKLYDMIRVHGIETRMLTGEIPMKERSQTVQDLNDGNVRVLVATSQLVGEGLDLPALSSVFLTTPIRFTGRVTQYIGRILRIASGKRQAIVYDYVDKPGVLVHSFGSRCYAYREMGVQTAA